MAALSINSLRQAEIAEAKKKLINNTQPKSNVVSNSNANAAPINTDYSALIAKRAAEGASPTELGEYERLRNDKISSQGLSYEKTYNYNKSPAPERPEVNNTFDTNALYQAQLAAKKAENEAFLNTQLNTLNKNYDTNLLGYQNQETDLQRNYEEGVSDIRQNTYNDIESGKVNAVNRGIMNSAMGLAMGQASKRQGSDNINTATQQRNDFLNEINSQINNLTKGYNSDTLTAQTNYGLANKQATNEALFSKLGADLSIYQQQAGFDNANLMQDKGFQQEILMQGNQFEQDVKMFGLESALRLQMQRISESGANSRANASNSLARDQFNWNKEMYGLERQDSLDAAISDAKQAYLGLGVDLNAKTRANYGFDFFGKDKKAAETSYNNQVEILKEQGVDANTAKGMVQDVMYTPGYKVTTDISEAMNRLINTLMGK